MKAKPMRGILAIVIPTVSVGCVLSGGDNHLFSTGPATSSRPSSSQVVLASCDYDFYNPTGVGCQPLPPPDPLPADVPDLNVPDLIGVGGSGLVGAGGPGDLGGGWRSLLPVIEDVH
jgi:hypothetical protein